MKSVITKKNIKTGFVEGKVEVDKTKYKFQAKVYGKGSVYGINEGRVSKLWVWRAEENIRNSFISYDRGWEYSPTNKTEEDILNAILKMFEKEGI